MLVEAVGLTKSYGQRAAVCDVSFGVRAGSIVGLLGANGAGKSTTLRLLTGYLRPDRGTALIDGHDVNAAPHAARAALGYLPEAPSGFRRLTVREFLTFAGEARGLRGDCLVQAIGETAARLGLEPAIDRTMGTLSKGYGQRAWLGQAVLHDPPVLILDEPTDGLDPGQKVSLRGLLRRLGRDKAILMSTHILEEAEELCDRIIVIANGGVVADSDVRDFLDASGRLGPAFARLTAGTSEPARP